MATKTGSNHAKAHQIHAEVSQAQESGQAVVTLDGKDFYLGPHGTKTSKLEYDRLIGEWLANGRTLPAGPDRAITVTQLALALAA